MSSSSRHYGDSDNSSIVDLPVIILPTELMFSSAKRRSLLTVFNPYGNEAQFRVMTTSPDRYDVSVTKGTIKPNRKIDITIRLLSHKLDDLPEPTEELQIIDYFRVMLRIGQLKGNQSIEVQWSNQAPETLESSESSSHLLGCDDIGSSRYKIKSIKSSASGSMLTTESTSTVLNRSFNNQRSAFNRSGRQVARTETPNGGSNVNLVCTICAIACVLTLFLPLSSDSELCKKAKPFSDRAVTQSSGFFAQLASIFSVSYEMKLGCSFALGLFTYRLISTLPD